MQGHQKAFHVRFWTGKFLMAASLMYAGAYYFKYNTNVKNLFICLLFNYLKLI